MENAGWVELAVMCWIYGEIKVVIGKDEVS
jgi:hypothetical protein